MKFDTLNNWIGLCGLILEYTHSSRYLVKHELMNFLTKVDSKFLVPIHSENPLHLKTSMLNKLNNCKIKLLQKKVSYTMNKVFLGLNADDVYGSPSNNNYYYLCLK